MAWPHAARLAMQAAPCYRITMSWPLSLADGAVRRVALVAPLLIALWLLVLWAML
jgi:hypothetical protein